MPSMRDPAGRDALVARLRRLQPDAARRWGSMTAPRMVAHLSDQMRHTLGDSVAARRDGFLRWRIVRHAVIYWIPWPKGRIKGPPEAFVTPPGSWEADVAGLETLVERFVARDPDAPWPEHALLGPMSTEEWGAFCYKHFDHHFRQFGV